MIMEREEEKEIEDVLPVKNEEVIFSLKRDFFFFFFY
jgi:hypothetical protein